MCFEIPRPAGSRSLWLPGCLLALLAASFVLTVNPAVWAQPPENGSSSPAPAESETPAENPAGSGDSQPSENGQPESPANPVGEPSGENDSNSEQPGDSTPQPPADAAEGNSTEDAEEASAEAEQPRTIDRLIYIPYEKLTEMFQGAAKVVISYEEYRKLLDKVAGLPDAVEADEPALITKAEYNAVVRGDMAEVTAKYTCRVLKKQWAEIPVQFGDAAVGELSVDGEAQVFLRGVGEGEYRLLFEKAGDVTVTLKLIAAVERSPAGPQLKLTVPAVGITTFSLTVPKADHDITVSPRNIPVKEQEKPAEGTTVTTVSLGATERISATWVPKTSERPEMDLLSTVDNALEISIRDGLVHTSAKLKYQILRGELKTLQVAVPKGQRILDVTCSTRMQGWTVKEEENRQVVEVELLSGASDSITLYVTTEETLGDEQLRLGGLSNDGATRGIHALDVTREQGTLTVSHGNELTLVVAQQAGLIRTETAKEANKLSFRYFTPSFQFAVRTEPLQAILDVQHGAYLTFREQRIDVDVRLSYTIRRAGIFHLDLELPEELTLTRVECPQMAEYQHDKQSRRLSIVLKESTQGELSLRLLGRLPRASGEEGNEFADLPLVRPLEVRQEEGRIGVYAVEAFEIVTDEENIESAQSISVNQLDVKIPDARPQAAWKFQTRPVTIPIKTIRRPTRMTAQTATRVQVEPSGLVVNTEVHYDIQYAGVEHFRIAVPAAVSDRVQIETVGRGDTPILQKSPEENGGEASAVEGDTAEDETAEGDSAENSAELAADDSAGDTEDNGSRGPPEDAAKDEPKFVVWAIQTQRPVSGRQRFRITYDIPLAGADNAEAADETEQPSEKQIRELLETIALVHPLGLNERNAEDPELLRSSGEVLVQVDPVLAVQMSAAGAGVEPIDVRELTLLPTSGQQAYRYPYQTAEDPVRLELTISRFEVEAVVSTVVSRMLAEFVIGMSDDMAVRVRMKIKSSQRQRLLLQLPANSEPMQVSVNGEPRQLQKGEAATDTAYTNYFVNVSRPGSSDEEFSLSLQYLMEMQPLSRTVPRGGLSLRLPQLQTPGGTPAVVQQTGGIVWLPDAFVPVTVDAPFERQRDVRSEVFVGGLQADTSRVDGQQTWIGGGTASSLEFPTDGRAFLFETVGAAEQLELTYWNRFVVAASLSLALLVIALILLRTGWENKLLVLIVAATLMTVLLQFEPAVARQGFYESRYGLAALAAIWIIHGLFQLSRCCQPAPVKEKADLDVPPLGTPSIHDEPHPPSPS